MTLKEAYQEYRSYYYNNKWTADDTRHYLKKNWIDYEEYNLEEFKEKVMFDDKFNEKWGQGCAKHITQEECYQYYPQLKRILEQKLVHVKAQEYTQANEYKKQELTIINSLPKRIIIDEHL
jgi:hypothetical protein